MVNKYAEKGLAVAGNNIIHPSTRWKKSKLAPIVEAIGKHSKGLFVVNKYAEQELVAAGNNNG